METGEMHPRGNTRAHCPALMARAHGPCSVPALTAGAHGERTRRARPSESWESVNVPEANVSTFERDVYVPFTAYSGASQAQRVLPERRGDLLFSPIQAQIAVFTVACRPQNLACYVRIKSRTLVRRGTVRYIDQPEILSSQQVVRFPLFQHV